MDQDDLMKRKTITMPKSMWEAVEMYRIQERMGTETEAVRRLVLLSLRKFGLINDQERSRPNE